MSPKKPSAWERKKGKRLAQEERLRAARTGLRLDDADSMIRFFEAQLENHQRVYGGGDVKRHIARAWTSLFRYWHRAIQVPEPTPRDRGTAHQMIREHVDRRAAARLAETLQ